MDHLNPIDIDLPEVNPDAVYEVSHEVWKPQNDNCAYLKAHIIMKAMDAIASKATDKS